MSTYEYVKGLFGLLDLIGEELDDFLEISADNLDRIRMPPYGQVYDIPFGKIIGYIFHTCGLLDEFVEVANSSEPQLRMLELAKTAEPKVGINQENVWPLLCSWIVMWKTLESMSVFGCSMHKLLREGCSGDDEALFKAVYIDRSALVSDAAARRVSTAEIESDGEFFEKLSKAIKRTRPTRPREHLDGVRLLLAIVDEMVGVSSVPASELTDWATEFELYPIDADALQAVNRQRQKFQKFSSHQ